MSPLYTVLGIVLALKGTQTALGLSNLGGLPARPGMRTSYAGKQIGGTMMLVLVVLLCHAFHV